MSFIEAIKSPLRPAYRRIKGSFQTAVWSVVSRNNVAAAFYSALGNRKMLREVKAVAAGQLQYKIDHESEAASFYLLRRNIHRLEKGLIMRPRRDVFGLDFIDRTVEVFERAVEASAGQGMNSEVMWARDVLSDYFDAVDTSHVRLKPAYERWLNLEVARSSSTANSRSVPYSRGETPSPISFDDFMALSRRRRSVRWFKPVEVDRDITNQALRAAAQAPSACNRQPFHFRIFDTPDKAAEITALAMGTKGFSQNVPAVAVVVGQLRAYPFERDRHVIYIDGSLAAMSFMYALETLGLASCPINWPDQEPHESNMKKALGLADDERVIMLIAFGEPDPEGMIPFSSKRDTNQIGVFD